MGTRRRLAPPNLPVAPQQYDGGWINQYSNVLRLFFNQLTNFVNSPLPYGSFYDHTTQTTSGPNVITYGKLGTTAEAYGMTVQDTGKVYITHSGVYNVQFSAQMQKAGGGTSDAYIWLIKNGQPIDDSAGYITISGGANAKALTSWNYVLTVNESDYIQLAWLSVSGDISLPTIPAPIAGVPDSPSLILTVTWVSGLNV